MAQFEVGNTRYKFFFECLPSPLHKSLFCVSAIFSLQIMVSLFMLSTAYFIADNGFAIYALNRVCPGNELRTSPLRQCEHGSQQHSHGRRSVLSAAPCFYFPYYSSGKEFIFI